ncbi:MAG: phospholipase/carboxylesterase [Rhodospirillales bacterium]|nr:phospholipase/carboxylesterase [Rhodospirillales bacterium]
MLPTLEGPSHPAAAGGKPRRLVVLLHGLGADGNDLIGLAPLFAQILPDAEFVAPNAPFPCDMGPYGHQWFSLQDRTPATLVAEVGAAAPILNAYIDRALATRGLGESDLALIGFSQGTMMALYVGLRREKPIAGIVGFSGALLAGEALPQEIRSRPPVLLVHGDADLVVPFDALAMAEASLKAAGVQVETLTCAGLGHGIDEAGLKRAAAFLQRVLGKRPQ